MVTDRVVEFYIGVCFPPLKLATSLTSPPPSLPSPPPSLLASQLNNAVSGALDRLHYEKDPCVRYDSARKVWIYLHRGRSEEDFGECGWVCRCVSVCVGGCMCVSVRVWVGACV